jgi:hypothetical protein
MVKRDIKNVNPNHPYSKKIDEKQAIAKGITQPISQAQHEKQGDNLLKLLKSDPKLLEQILIAIRKGEKQAIHPLKKAMQQSIIQPTSQHNKTTQSRLRHQTYPTFVKTLNKF